MRIKKSYLITIIALILIGLGFSVYQYIETMKAGVASATQTIPNPGHSWAEMESGPDSIQVSGRTITNLAAPVASTDAANKTYVDAAGGTQTYTMCYVQNGGSACASGFTILSHFNGTSWVADNAMGTTNGALYAFGLGGATTTISFCTCAGRDATTAGEICLSMPCEEGTGTACGARFGGPGVKINGQWEHKTATCGAGTFFAVCCK